MEFLSDLALGLCFALYEMYAKCVLIVAKFYPSYIQRLVKRNVRSFGVTLNGSEPTDVQVVSAEQFYGRVAAYRHVGLLDAYMDGAIDIKDPVGFAVKFMNSKHWLVLLHPLSKVLPWFNLQTRKKAWEVGRSHYDIGNDLYEAMLDENMQYSCGYWKEAKTLDEAQMAKMELIAQKLHLKPGMRVLDIGCGFGTLACHLAKSYGVSVVGCTISKEQTKYGRKKCEGLDVDIRLCDYRDIDEKFDRIVSVGTFEHIGPKNYREFMQVVHRCLKDDGLFLLHTIGCSHLDRPCVDMWTHKHIFVNGQIPYYMEVARAIEGLWVIEDWHNFGWYYANTLAAWLKKFEDSWPRLRTSYNEQFYRMWKMYLSLAQGLFLTRGFEVWQIVLSKEGLKQVYVSVR